MFKRKLRQLIDHYNKAREASALNKDDRITLLEDFLNQPDIKILSDFADISITEFTEYLTIKLKDDERKRQDFFSEDFLQGNSLAAEVIKQFMNAETTVEFADPTKTSIKKIAFVLDLDENLISTIASTSEPESYLSKSAEIHLSRSSDGIIEHLAITPELKVARVTAFRRQEWKAFFERVVAINDRYCEVTGDKTPIIQCLFLTSGLYAADEFKQTIFTRFYGKELADKIIPDPLYFFNRKDQQSEVGDLDKGKFLSVLFPCLGLQSKKDLTLVDDNYENINSALGKGFSIIYHPASISFRPPGATFSNHREHVFAELKRRLDFIEEKVQALENSKRLTRL